ncbi:MAG: hypothetical protein HY079_01305 [Elusimicrobia bacterium]|nr:hypothetical protein [Elusimicrobiota bacterium]
MSLKSLSKAELREGLVERKSDDHKGVFGHALIVGGSRGMAGAAILAARAALRSGAGLVSVAVPVSVSPTVAGAVPSAMTLGLPETAGGAFRPDGVERLKNYAKDRRVTACAIGPGIATARATRPSASAPSSDWPAPGAASPCSRATARWSPRARAPPSTRRADRPWPRAAPATCSPG